VPLDVRIFTTAPYAGITQVRFKGYDLSRSGTPRLIYFFILLLSFRMIKQIVKILVHQTGVSENPRRV
jgi:hypothetical protein